MLDEKAVPPRPTRSAPMLLVGFDPSYKPGRRSARSVPRPRWPAGVPIGVLRPIRRVGMMFGSGAAMWECLCDPQLGGCGRKIIASKEYLRRRTASPPEHCCNRCPNREPTEPAGREAP